MKQDHHASLKFPRNFSNGLSLNSQGRGEWSGVGGDKGHYG